MVSTKKLMANRQNAQLSTGPKDTAVTRLNATKHGILCGGGVIEAVDGEDTQELFEELRAQMWQAWAPAGFLEEELVYQLLDNQWRRRRLRRWETNLIQAQTDDMIDRWENQSRQRELPAAVTAGNDTGKSSLAAHQFLAELGEGYKLIVEYLESGQPLSALPDSSSIVDFVEREYELKVIDILGAERPSNAETTEYSSAEVQKVIDTACETAIITENELYTAFKAFVDSDCQLTSAELKRQRRSLDHALALASLPDDASFAKLVRYDALLFNQYFKLFHELQRVQAGRKGEKPSLPVAVDVNVGVATSGSARQCAHHPDCADTAMISGASPGNAASEAGKVVTKMTVIDQAVAPTSVKRGRGRPRRSTSGTESKIV